MSRVTPGPAVTTQGQNQQLTSPLLSLPSSTGNSLRGAATPRVNLGADSTQKQAVEGFCLGLGTVRPGAAGSARGRGAAAAGRARPGPGAISRPHCAPPPEPGCLSSRLQTRSERSQPAAFTCGGAVYFLFCGVHILCRESREFSDSGWDFRPA